MSEAAAPLVIVIMGVSGSGKTTIAGLLAGQLHWELAEADSFHSAASIAKMRSGIALEDEDRWPWLRAIAAWIDAARADHRHAVVTCSALKRSYCDIIIGDRPDVRLVYLKGDFELVAQRMLARQGHFMPLSLLRSQFDTLDEPDADENALIVPIDIPPRQIVERIITALRL